MSEELYVCVPVLTHKSGLLCSHPGNHTTPSNRTTYNNEERIMDNQHRKISSYLELNQEEIDLMNEVKALGPQLEVVVEKVRVYLEKQFEAAIEQREIGTYDEFQRLLDVEPTVWFRNGKHDLQTGLMALTRAIAQPTFF